MTELMSMTGFGEGTADADGVRATASVRGVNHKQLDVRITLPAFASSLETEIAAAVRGRCARGRIEVRVSVTRLDDGGTTAGPSAELAALVGTLRDVQTTFGLAGDVSVGDVLRAGGVSLLSSSADPPFEQSAEAILRACGLAVDAFVDFRAREGRGLAKLFEASADELVELIAAIERQSGDAIDAHRARLSSRVGELLAGTSAAEVEPGRIEQEVVLLAERSDIAEEIQRARAHVGALRDVTAAGGPHGKRLDFLLQELIRETNTMASKSVSAALTHLVVDAKTIVERLREQAQNLE